MSCSNYISFILSLVVGFSQLFGIVDTYSKYSLDNSIIGQPYISCERDQIVIELITEKPFFGKVFVKGEYSNPKCSKTFRDGSIITDDDEPKDDHQVFMGSVTKSNEQKRTEEQFRIEEGRIEPPPPPSPHLEKNNESDWRSIGGATSDQNAAFGGSKGEEIIHRVETKGEQLRVFDPKRKNPESLRNEESDKCAKQQSCEPCNCDERRSRRATNSIRLTVPIDSCNSKRDRKLNPPSLVISFVAMVSFHNNFITKLDKSYHIQCAYAEAEKTVSTDIDVSMSDDETELSSIVEAPTCEYLISDENGTPIHNGVVGELVNHKWSCKGGIGSKLRMLVHDCFVMDISGEQSMVIDTNGCSTDQYTLQTPTYSDDGLTAQVNAYIFKFPDKSTVDFKCSITFCSIEDQDCQLFIPPKCDRNQNRSNLRLKRSNNEASSVSLHSNSMTVFDIDADFDGKLSTPSPISQSLLSFDSISSSFCMSISSFGLLISASTFFFTISLALLFAFIFIKSNQKFFIE